MTNIAIRPAGKPDAAAFTVLADIAGYGLPVWFWSNSPDRQPGESALAFGRRRFMEDEGIFTYRNAQIAEFDGEVAGLMLGFREPDQPGEMPDDLPDPVRPLLELEALVPGTWYVNILAVFEEFRGRQIGRALLEKADEIGRQTRASGVSLIVEDDNPRAMRLYERLGYGTVASRPYVTFPGCGPAQNWVLMVKPFDRAQ